MYFKTLISIDVDVFIVTKLLFPFCLNSNLVVKQHML